MKIIFTESSPTVAIERSPKENGFDTYEQLMRAFCRALNKSGHGFDMVVKPMRRDGHNVPDHMLYIRRKDNDMTMQHGAYCIYDEAYIRRRAHLLYLYNTGDRLMFKVVYYQPISLTP